MRYPNIYIKYPNILYPNMQLLTTIPISSTLSWGALDYLTSDVKFTQILLGELRTDLHPNKYITSDVYSLK